jgi:nitrous oxidase accessory protein NosD
MKKLLLTTVLIGFLFAIQLLAIFPFSGFCSDGTIITVNPGYSIQDAINSANNGDTILVKAGIYNEKEIVVNKTLNILGENAETTIIDGEILARYIFHIIANNVTIENFTLKNTILGDSYEYPAIELYNVTNVLIKKVYILNASIGINIQSSNYTKITYSIIKDCKYRGLRFRDGSCNNTVISNTFENNSMAMLIADSESEFNLIYHNNFINNMEDVNLFGFPNYFDNGYPSGGNYWSRHTAPDIKYGPYQNETGSDGILDEAYNLIDNYPLAHPFTTWKISVEGENFQIGISTNSTVNSISLNKEAKTLILNLTVNENANDSCRISIPKRLLSCDSPYQWNVSKTYNEPLSYLALEDADETYIYFTYNCLGLCEIKINGTKVVLEFLSAIILISFLIIATLTTQILKIVSKRAEV